jgi:hypothetical protein
LQTKAELIQNLRQLIDIPPPNNASLETVGDLFDWVWTAGSVRFPDGVNAPWLAACWALQGVEGIEGSRWKGDTRLETLLPRPTRQAQWKALGERLSGVLPRLEHRPGVGPVARSVVLTVGLVTFLLLRHSIFTGKLSFLFPEVWWFLWGINMLFFFFVLQGWLRADETEIPDRFATVNSLGKGWRLWVLRQPSQYPPQQAVLWMLIRQIVADAAVCPLKMVRRETSLADLGLE